MKCLARSTALSLVLGCILHIVIAGALPGQVVSKTQKVDSDAKLNAILAERDMRQFTRLVVSKLDPVQKARSWVIRDFVKNKPPRAFAGQETRAAARAQDKSARYTQFVRMSTQLMNELQNTERELIDTLETMQRDLDDLWQTYASMRDQAFRINERITTALSLLRV